MRATGASETNPVAEVYEVNEVTEIIDVNEQLGSARSMRSEESMRSMKPIRSRGPIGSIRSISFPKWLSHDSSAPYLAGIGYVLATDDCCSQTNCMTDGPTSMKCVQAVN